MTHSTVVESEAWCGRALHLYSEPLLRKILDQLVYHKTKFWKHHNCVQEESLRTLKLLSKKISSPESYEAGRRDREDRKIKMRRRPNPYLEQFTKPKLCEAQNESLSYPERTRATMYESAFLRHVAQPRWLSHQKVARASCWTGRGAALKSGKLNQNLRKIPQNNSGDGWNLVLQSVSASQQVCSHKVEEQAGRVARESKSESLRTSLLTPLAQETTPCCDGKAEKNPPRAGQRRAGKGRGGTGLNGRATQLPAHLRTGQVTGMNKGRWSSRVLRNLKLQQSLKCSLFHSQLARVTIQSYANKVVYGL
jgi:hypothetical protein